ncbi:MAG: hypothetical protein CMD84_00415 [Gammaproteobacteria bacterium]|nr:hypothetical protein [Gammaproteobacteria bacterium]|tara:strand:+ start:90 stop:704 length:615 start_codon:yes stop_codon:yes gene_type:complete
MNNSLIPTAVLISFSVIATGCGLFESNDDEIQTLRAELVQLREDVLDLETEIELLAVAPPQPEPLIVTTTTMPEVEDVQATTTTAQLPILPSIIDTVVNDSEVEAILVASYQWGPSSVAEALQTVLGIEADGWYGNGTRAAHVAALEERGLVTDGVPSVPTTTTTTEVQEEGVEVETSTETVVETTTTVAESTTAETTTTVAAG